MKSLVVAAVVVLSGSAGALADIAWLNPAYPLSIGNVPGVARLRADQNNWDLGLIQGTNPVNARTANVIGAGGAPDALTAGKTYGLTFEGRAGLGLRLTLTDNAGGTTYVQSWGDASLGGNNAATINGAGPRDLYYNTVHAYAQVQNRSTSQVSSVTWSNLVFSSAALTNAGSLTDGSLAPVLGDTTVYTFDNWVYTTTDLRTIDWTISANVRIVTNSVSPNPSERLKFEFGLKDASPVPTPGAMALLCAGGALATRRRRR